MFVREATNMLPRHHCGARVGSLAPVGWCTLLVCNCALLLVLAAAEGSGGVYPLCSPFGALLEAPFG